jgi:YrbI family 3-deoxy-D-manno-octulosonate 8-phosphate phosphatase
MKVVFIGSGNVAVHLAPAMQKAGFSVEQVYSRSAEGARTLAGRLDGAAWTTETDAILRDADLYVFAVKDDVLPDLITRIPANHALWIHTAGGLPMDIFKGHAERYGVLYPLQTFSKNRETDFGQAPCFIEACSPEEEAGLRAIAGRLSGRVQTLSSEKRKHLHLAAVFACNFSNHMYALAGKIVTGQGLPAEVLLPLIDETAAKIHALPPETAQTGPAVRNDRDVMKRHLSLLTDPDMKNLYQLISTNICKEKNMSSIPYDLRKVKAFLFDVDGVLSSDRISLAENGDPMRTAHIKDGYAMQLAIKCGYQIGIITGAYTENIRTRYANLGVQHIYLRSAVKIHDYEDFLLKTGLRDDETVYAGDDIPDYAVMQRVGLAVAPSTAAPEIKAIAGYVSALRGGEGIAREIIEQTLKVQGLWMTDEAFGW